MNNILIYAFNRLFIVCQPEAPPISILKDVLCRFGSFIDVYLLPGKNYGYASFANEECAIRAIEVILYLCITFKYWTFCFFNYI